MGSGGVYTAQKLLRSHYVGSGGGGLQDGKGRERLGVWNGRVGEVHRKECRVLVVVTCTSIPFPLFEPVAPFCSLDLGQFYR